MSMSSSAYVVPAPHGTHACTHARRPRYYFWESILQVETLTLVCAEVFSRSLDSYRQTLVMQVTLAVIAVVNMTVAPNRSLGLALLEFISTAVLVATLALSLNYTDAVAAGADPLSQVGGSPVEPGREMAAVIGTC